MQPNDPWLPKVSSSSTLTRSSTHIKNDTDQLSCESRGCPIQLCQIGSFSVKGVGFSARLRLPVTKRAIEGGQYRIDDAAHWQKLVDNMAAIVAELERTFVPAIEAAAGPAPEWFTPEG